MRGGGAGADEVLAGVPARVTELEARLAAVERERDQYRTLYEFLREENAQLKRGLLGRRVERPGDDDAQLTLSILAMLLGEAPETT